MVKRRRAAAVKKSPHSVDFGAEVRRRRLALNWTREKLSEHAELTANYIGAIENGLRDPSLTTVRKLAKGLGIQPGALLGLVRELSPKAHEMATLFSATPPEIQASILMILRGVTRP